MKRLISTGLTLGAAGLALAAPGAAAAAAATEPQGTTVPEALRVPAGQQKVLTIEGIGSQVYDCVGGGWRFREPTAVLTRGRRTLGIHFGGPNWQSLADGSRVTGRLRTSVPAPRPERDIPLLLIEADANFGNGIFADVDYIQRLRTRGGVAPTGACDPATQPSASIPYRSTYVFWAPPPQRATRAARSACTVTSSTRTRGIAEPFQPPGCVSMKADRHGTPRSVWSSLSGPSSRTA